MDSNKQSDSLTDPVCGPQVPANGPHRQALGGALFSFCSPACHEKFRENPLQFVVLFSTRALPSGVGGGPPPSTLSSEAAWAPAPLVLDPGPVPSPAAPPPHASEEPPAPFAPPATTASGGPPTLAPSGGALDTIQPVGSTTIVRWDLPEQPRAREPSARAGASARTPPPRRAGVLARLFPESEQRYARRASRDLLALYHSTTRANPGLRGRDLYRAIVRTRLGFDNAAAERLLDQAEESFASWPSDRPLKFCDVVHIIVISEYSAAHADAHWIRTNMGEVVAREIPQEL